MPVTWLHISDLHIRTGDSYDRDVVFRALVRSVERFRERGERTPDLIFATGDIAHSGRPEEYEIVTEFFDQLLHAANLDRHQLYVVPGNHDVDRNVGRQLIRELRSRSEADEYFRPGAPKLHLTHKLGPFLRWHRHYFDGIRKMPEDSTCGPVELVEVRGHRLSLLPINTALFCLADDDHERLFVGRRCLDASLQELDGLGADIKIAFMHHPIQDLSLLERQQIRSGLVDNVDVILTGHLHEAGYAVVGMFTARNLYCAAGATYQTRDWPNTASYATFDGGQVTIFPIRYEDQPRELWTVDPSQFPEEAGHEMSFPVPRGRDFRGFRALGRDTAYRVPRPQSAAGPAPVVAAGPKLGSGGGVRFLRAEAEDWPATSRTSARGPRRTSNKRKNNNKNKGED
jgi:predicted phosphodiesterase